MSLCLSVCRCFPVKPASYQIFCGHLHTPSASVTLLVLAPPSPSEKKCFLLPGLNTRECRNELASYETYSPIFRGHLEECIVSTGVLKTRWVAHEAQRTCTLAAILSPKNQLLKSLIAEKSIGLFVTAVMGQKY